MKLTGQEIIADALPFLAWLAEWYNGITPSRFEDVIPDPSAGAILCADLIVGFCTEGPLASDRINAIVPATVDLLQKAHEAGVTSFVLVQDTHNPDTPEFEAWPAHCVRGSRESVTVPELRRLSFANEFIVIEKNTLSPGIGTMFQDWLERNDGITDYVVTGNCTDLCTYQLAMYVRMWANATNRQGKRVTVDSAAVDTFDVPVAAANGGLPHLGDFTNMYFLYHMALNGIRIVSNIT